MLSLLAAVHDWPGRLPSELGLCKPEEDLLYIAAYANTKGMIEAVDNKLQEIELEKIRNKK